MPKNDLKLSTEIDAGKFFKTLFYIFFSIGLLSFSVWYFGSVYNASEREYIRGARYAYSILQKEITTIYQKQGFVFDNKTGSEDSFCLYLAEKYSKDSVGACTNFNPTMPSENFTFKDQKISIYGLEKPVFSYNGNQVKDIIIDVNGEKKGENQVGKDRVILRIYSKGQSGGIITPVNCSNMDESDYGFKKSIYCIGSQEFNYLTSNKPLGFDIQQTNMDNGTKRIIGNNLSFIRADCSVTDGMYTGAEDYCEDKSFYSLRGCEDEYECNIELSRTY